MTCRRVTLENGFSAIVCGRGVTARRCRCGGPEVFLCDWKVERRGNNAATCDAPVCERCTTKPEAGKDLCPTHAGAWAAWKRARAGSDSAAAAT